MNFVGRGSIVLLLFGIFNLFYIKNIKFSFEGVLLLFMSFGMIIAVLMFPGNNIISELIKTFNYVLSFVVGYCGYIIATDKEKYIRRTLFSLYLGYVIHILLMYMNNVRIGTEGRTLISIWTGEAIAVTLVGLLSSYVVAYAISNIIYAPKLLLKIFGVIGVVAVFLINMQTATRTPFVSMLILTAVLLILGFAANEHKNYNHLLAIVFVAILLIALFGFDLFGIRTIVMESPIVERFEQEGMQTSRFEIAKNYFAQMFSYPFGGNQIAEIVGQEAHNLWQQFYDFYGIIPTALLLVITTSMIVKLIQLFFLKYKKPLEYTLIAIYFISFIQMLLEPVVTGYPILFWTFLLIHGMATNYYKDRVNEHNIKKERFL